MVRNRLRAGLMGMGKRPDSDFEAILAIHSAGDRVFIRSLLDAEGIVYFIQGEHVAPYVYHALPMRLMVRRDQADRVRAMLRDFDAAGAYDGLKG